MSSKPFRRTTSNKHKPNSSYSRNLMTSQKPLSPEQLENNRSLACCRRSALPAYQQPWGSPHCAWWRRPIAWDPLQNDRRSPCPVIVRYLNYSDRVALLRSFRKSKALQLDGHKLLMFADYSQEVSRRRKISNLYVQPFSKRG